MKKWFKAIIKNADGDYEGSELVKAESQQEAIADIVENWSDYPHTDNAEEYSVEFCSLTCQEQAECNHRDVAKAFMADGCTAAEAEHHIKNGGEAIKAAEWNQYAADNGMEEKLEDIPAHGDCISRVVVDNEEYVILYVL